MNWYQQAKSSRKITSAVMSWYDFYRYAQIWNVRYDESSEELASQIAAMYELEYKYSMIKNNPFQGMPKRRENITNRLQEKLSEVIAGLRTRLLFPFEKWLEFHALLSPETWARKRVQEFVESGEIESAYRNAVFEYDKYVNHQGAFASRPGNEDAVFHQMILKAESEITKFPALSRLLAEGLMGYREMLMDDLHSEGFESFGERYSKEFKDIDEAETFIDNLSVNEVDFESLLLLYFEDIKGFVDSAERTGQAEEMLVEFFQHLVFPGWFEYWSSMGDQGEHRKHL